MHRAELNIRFDSREIAQAVFKSLIPEGRVSLRNVKVNVELSDGEITIAVEALDESALRAALNSLTKLTYLVLEVLKIR
ncbi:MAG: KEOPS complex subunit Pcc1 [Sulfolobales archaeon]|nr:KEOPS complex subunit Pcc1 [Sulfolobales archaeon]MDW8082343.1 KEOPS complex subunit Pcc1 [Sulfolobales archaeon]